MIKTDVQPKNFETDEILVQSLFEENRCGKILISKRLFMAARLDDLNKIFHNIFPVRQQYLFELDAFEYMVYSPYFDRVGQNIIPPQYSATFGVDYKNGKMVDFQIKWMQSPTIVECNYLYDFEEP